MLFTIRAIAIWRFLIVSWQRLQRFIGISVGASNRGLLPPRGNTEQGNEASPHQDDVVLLQCFPLIGSVPVASLSDAAIEIFSNNPSRLSDNIDSFPYKNTFLLQAIATNATQMAIELIDLDRGKSSIDISDKDPAGGNTPLILALKKGNFDVVKKLLTIPGITVDHRDGHGLSALHWAAILRAPSCIIEKLIEQGAKDYPLDIDGRLMTAKDIYYSAIEYRTVECISLHNQPDDLSRSKAAVPLLSDLHWHVIDILKNEYGVASNADIEIDAAVIQLFEPLRHDSTSSFLSALFEQLTKLQRENPSEEAIIIGSQLGDAWQQISDDGPITECAKKMFTKKRNAKVADPNISWLLNSQESFAPSRQGMSLFYNQQPPSVKVMKSNQSLPEVIRQADGIEIHVFEKSAGL